MIISSYYISPTLSSCVWSSLKEAQKNTKKIKHVMWYNSQEKIFLQESTIEKYK